MAYKIIHGDCIKVLKEEFEENSIDAICTDSPYGIKFMSTPDRDWDKFELKEFQEWVIIWGKELLRVLKPGGFGLFFGHPRSYHRLTCGLEDAGFFIKDCIMWIYGEGFAKSKRADVAVDKFLGKTGPLGKAVRVTTRSKDEQANLEKPESAKEYIPKTVEALKQKGRNTAIKPAYEPIALVQKPLSGSVGENIIKFGTGSLNIDDCKIKREDKVTINRFKDGMKPFGDGAGHKYESIEVQESWPSNIMLDEESAKILDDQTSETKFGIATEGKSESTKNVYGKYKKRSLISIGDKGGVSRFFYVKKAKPKEKDAGLNLLPEQKVKDSRKTDIDNPYQRGESLRKNIVVSVKPIELMRYLLRLIVPYGGVVIDPFMGSGSTLVAARIEKFHCIGIDKGKEECEIAKKRVAYAGIEAGDATEQDANEIGTRTQLGLFGKEDD